MFFHPPHAHLTPMRRILPAGASQSIFVLGWGCLVLAALPGCDRLESASNASLTQTPSADRQPASQDELRVRIDRALDYNRSHRHMDQGTNAAWQVVHGVLVYGPDLQMYKDGKLVSALDYLLRGGPINGWNLRPADHGVMSVLEAGSKTGMGHPDQWIGYLSQCGLSLDEPLMVGGKEYKVGDLLSQSQWDIYPGMEATWTLMAASAYLPADAHWTARDGSEWTIDRIVDMEADADPDTAACGGSHRMYALAVALNRHLEAGGKLEGPWLKADQKIKEAVAKVRANQQPDGTYSTNYFQRPSTSDDMGTRLGTTGHTFEFLTVALNDEQIHSPWFNKSLLALTRHAGANAGSGTRMRRAVSLDARLAALSGPRVWPDRRAVTRRECARDSAVNERRDPLRVISRAAIFAPRQRQLLHQLLAGGD